MKYFKDLSNVQEVKKTFRKLAFTNHPDRGGNEEVFKMIVNEYEIAIKEAYDNEQNMEKEEKTTHAKTFNDFSKLDKKFMEIITKFINVEGIEIDIVGDFIWMYGNTYPIKDLIKELGGKWAKSKKKWYFAPSWWNPKGKKFASNYNEITSKYGVEKVEKSTVKLLGN